MPAYVTLFNWTEQGVKNLKDTTQRAQAARQMWEEAGGRFIGIWWTLGQYDGVVLHETPDDETANKLLMSVGMLGNIRTTTLRAFGEDEMERILGGMF
ncbi:MAG TPA: GYD domain-containing protein [Anaerolineales bacterium]|nr:GYD domain-containing protein [Anaerolineales bacterium]